jgi:hypothetical protein
VPHLGDVLNSPVLPVLVDLESRGVSLRLDEDGMISVRPASRLTEDDRRLLLQYRPDLVTLLKVVDDGVAERQAAFRQQVDRAPVGTLPPLLYVPGVAYVRGVCFSCGDKLEELRFARCWRCALAWRLACRVPVPAAAAAARDQAREV